ncbi:MAG: 30S ribosomal protein S26e [Candidatus Thorarchaeota archaeon]
MGKKRKSGGRSKGSSGKSKSVQCSKCGRMVPADKAKRYTKRVSAVDPQLARELRQQGIGQTQHVRYYCPSNIKGPIILAGSPNDGTSSASEIHSPLSWTL